MIIIPKVVFIGDKTIANFLNKENGAFHRLQWELLAVTETPNELYLLLEDENSGVKPEDINVILTTDALYSTIPDEFISLLSFYAPYYMIGIFSYKPELQPSIIEATQEEAIKTGQGSAPIYFLSSKKPIPELALAKERYILNNESDPFNVKVIKGEDISDTIEETQEYTSEQLTTYKEEDNGNEYNGKVIAVTSSKGGSGKSTVALSIATYLAHSSIQSVAEGLEEKPLKIIVIDLDVRDGQLGFLIGEKSPTVLQILKDGVSNESVDNATIYNSRLKISTLLAPKRPRHADSIPPELYQDIINILKKKYDYIFIDTSVNYLDPLLEKVAYPMSDNIIFITDIVINSVYSMVRWIQEVTMPKDRNGMGINRGKIGIVVNKYIQDVIDRELLIKASQGISILSLIPNQAKTLAHATNLNNMQLALKNKVIRDSIGTIAKTITGKSYQLSDNLNIN